MGGLIFVYRLASLSPTVAGGKFSSNMPSAIACWKFGIKIVPVTNRTERIILMYLSIFSLENNW
jgi:hypothetical protein